MPFSSQVCRLGFLLSCIALAAPSYGQDRYQLMRDIDYIAGSVSRDVYSSNASDSNLIQARDLLTRARSLILSQGPITGELICEPYSSGSAYVIRASDRARIGNYTSLANCNEIIRSTFNGMVCAPYSTDSAYITNIASLQRIGNYTSISKCNEMVRRSTYQLMCEPYSSNSAYIYKIQDRSRIGNYTSTDRCIQAVSAASQRYVCAPYSSESAYITEIATGQRIGNYLPFDQCLQNIPFN